MLALAGEEFDWADQGSMFWRERGEERKRKRWEGIRDWDGKRAIEEGKTCGSVSVRDSCLARGLGEAERRGRKS